MPLSCSFFTISAWLTAVAAQSATRSAPISKAGVYRPRRTDSGRCSATAAKVGSGWPGRWVSMEWKMAAVGSTTTPSS